MARRRRRPRRRYKSLSDYLHWPDWLRLPDFDLDPEIKKGIWIVFLLTVGAIGVLSLFDLAGLLGQYYKQGLVYLFGWGKFLLPIMFLLLGFMLYREEEYEVNGANYLGAFLFLLSLVSLFELFIDQSQWDQALQLGRGGGYLGKTVAGAFIKLMGFWAALIVIISLFLISLMLLFNTTLARLIGRESWFGRLFSFLFVKFFQRRGKDDEDYEEPEDEEEEAEEEEESGEETEEDEADDEEEKGEEDDEEEEVEQEEEKPLEPAPAAYFSQKTINNKVDEDFSWQPTGLDIELPLDLLSRKRGKPTSGDIKRNMEIIEHTLRNFGIEVEMGEVSVGPTVTQYTFRPAEGVRLSRITALGNDLALALAAHPIRIEAPIPGRSLVGVEVPNQAKALVGLRELLESKEFKKAKSNLSIGLGKDVAGKPWIADIVKMPHLLVAGTTGSGKSVCLNSIIVSLLYQNTPDDLRFIMVDPKRVELPVYNGIPYLLTPVITEVDKTINALRWCLNEMDRRFNILSKHRKRNIQDFNASSKIKLPYIIFIIDELADLMVVASREVEAAIIRLAQMARAVGIHLILATQRPSVDVITGLIKANMPARIAFRVASSIDSRTILDSLGAEKLLGQGDMLFLSAEVSKPKRLQGAFVSDVEIKRIVRTIKEQAEEPLYLNEVTQKQKVGGLAGVGLSSADEDGDELLDEAKEIVIREGKASTSLLQRKLRIGYGRAAKIIDILEEAGIVGPANGSKPREVLVSAQELAAWQEQPPSAVALHSREESNMRDEYLDTEEDEGGEEEVEGEEEYEEQEDDNQNKDKESEQKEDKEIEDNKEDEEEEAEEGEEDEVDEEEAENKEDEDEEEEGKKEPERLEEDNKQQKLENKKAQKNNLGEKKSKKPTSKKQTQEQISKDDEEDDDFELEGKFFAK